MDPHHSSSSPTSLDSLANDVRTLRLSVQVALVSLVILSAAIGLYLFRQVQMIRRQTEFSTRTAEQMAKNYTLNLATQAVDFERQLLEFAKKNPDLQARLAKFYPAHSGTPPSSTPPSSTPPSSTPPGNR
ncbi:MAG: hypothetical protein IT580_15665 [Verrucomicrobiales bacterium]|nr:hypothetical protein [Verrucomicrobiales bacterium]